MLSFHQQAHYAHTDIKPPHMTKYERWSKLSKFPTEDTSYGRKVFVRTILAIGGMAFVTAAKNCIYAAIDFKNPSSAALAVAQTEVNIGKIVEGMVQLYYVVSLGYPIYGTVQLQLHTCNTFYACVIVIPARKPIMHQFAATCSTPIIAPL